ncbi:chymotrypsin inhibitor [Neocloeon triangulifer]|uniref:chymotrypsin inhibitor n=1 Tax=Neocloeon triangulifer TaxID=2078957 RepID=UPI00286F01D1|nr:chymotrypsin inhibitor [Neocloeon triangulifer]
MTKFIIGAILIVLLTTASFTQALPQDQETRELEAEEVEECVNGEVFLECGSECPEACYNIGQSRACGLSCKTGCFCSEGLVRNPDGDCVPPSKCPDLH